MSKYKKCFDEMIKSNPKLFADFKEIHDKYALDRIKHKEEFNSIGAQVLEVIKHYENILCNHQENVGYAKYSGGLADKFWGEIRLHYPRIDFVGIK